MARSTHRWLSMKPLTLAQLEEKLTMLAVKHGARPVASMVLARIRARLNSMEK